MSETNTTTTAPHIKVLTEGGVEITPKRVQIDDEEGVYLITITIADADLSGTHTFGT